MSDRHLLILDLDETLVYASESPPPPRVDFTVGPYGVMKRPHVGEFISSVQGWFDLAVWTSSGESYARVVVAQLFPRPEDLAFVWCSDRCGIRYDADFGKYGSTKPLRKLKRQGYMLDRVLVLDDTPAKHAKNYGNLVPIKAFEGDETDDELLKVLPFLDRLKAAQNVRRIEKRFWSVPRRA